jgi:solute carrier family 1 (neuronal/epithelial high affinity glutamate transporter), member 1
MNSKHQKIILIGIVSGVFLGLVCGIFFSETALHFKMIGDIFMKLLKMIVVPLILTSIIVGISSLGDIRKIGRTGGLTIAYYMTTTIIAVIIGIVLVTSMQPGAGVAIGELTVDEHLMEISQEKEAQNPWVFALTLIDRMIPANVFDAMAKGKILPLIVFSLLLGGILTTCGERGKLALDVIRGLNEAIMKLVFLILWYAPVGIFGLVAYRFGKAVVDANGLEGVKSIFTSLGSYMTVLLAGLAIHTVFLMLLLFFVTRRNPFVYARNMLIALLNAFGSASSSATLPLTMECTQVANKVSSRSTQFVLPLGATINMDGTALYEAVASIYIAQAWGIDLSMSQVVLVSITATLAAIGAAGIPEAGLFTMVMVLHAVGLPLEGISLILVVDWLMDRCRTTVNVWGDGVGAAIVDHFDQSDPPTAPA